MNLPLYDEEAELILEGLRDLQVAKESALRVTNEYVCRALGTFDTHPIKPLTRSVSIRTFSEADFGIPDVKALIVKIEKALSE